MSPPPAGSNGAAELVCDVPPASFPSTSGSESRVDRVGRGPRFVLGRDPLCDEGFELPDDESFDDVDDELAESLDDPDESSAKATPCPVATAVINHAESARLP